MWALALLGCDDGSLPCAATGCGHPTECAWNAWFRDADGDGRGDPGHGVCVETDGYVEDATDCDDSNAGIPANVERCDGSDVDEDCDGLVDDADPDHTGNDELYTDADGDGYGDPYGLVYACPGAEGLVRNDEDCDDTNAERYPGAEDPYPDGLDRDCDGIDGVTIGTDQAAWTFEDPEGNAVQPFSGGDVTGDGGDDLVVGSPNSEWFGASLGAVYVLPTKRAGALTTDDAVAMIHGIGSDNLFGTSVAFLKDGEETTGLAVGELTGTVYIFDVPLPEEQLADTARAWLESPTGWDGDLRGVGDVDGDGVTDVTVADVTQDDAAERYLISGLASGHSPVADAAFAVFTGLSEPRMSSLSAPEVDVDGDGTGDAVLGSPAWGSRTADVAVYVFLGPLSGRYEPSSADATILPTEEDSREFGRDLQSADFDGDGGPDLAIAVPAWTDGETGRVRVYLNTGTSFDSSPAGTVTGEQTLSFADGLYPYEGQDAGNAWLFVLAGVREHEKFGTALYGVPNPAAGVQDVADGAQSAFIRTAGGERSGWVSSLLASGPQVSAGSTAAMVYVWDADLL